MSTILGHPHDVPVGHCPHLPNFGPADGVRAAGERAVRLPHPPVPHVRVHDQLHPQTQAPPGEVHDEQRPGEFHHPAGTCPHPPQIKPGVPYPGRFVLTAQVQLLGWRPCSASPE